jgi:proton-dependent oligopeptide transporter, POT family
VATPEPLALAPAPFPRLFWFANVTELFERAAYYSVASFVVIYLGQLGLGKTWPSTLNGSVLWFLVYFLPIFSGTIADQIGFRRALLGAFVLLAAGYVAMGAPVWFLGAPLSPEIHDEVTAGTRVWVPIVAGVLLIGVGGSIVKPCISGTVQKTHGGRPTLAFAVFYMVINVGSLVGRIVAYFVRKGWNVSYIFAIGATAATLAFFAVFFFYRDPPAAAEAERRRRSIVDTFLGVFRVLSNGRFVLFLLVSTGFWFLYSQVYNVLPLYTKRTLETNPAMELYTAANPLVIVLFQLLVTRVFGKMKPIRSIVVGTVIIAASMVVNLLPVLTQGGPRALAADWLPIGSLFIILTVALIAFGELFTASRTFEWIGALAPKGQEGLFLGYANLPMAFGALISGPVGPWIFNDVMCKGAVRRPDGLLSLEPQAAARGWLLLMGIGVASALSMWGYNVWLERQAPAAGR